MLGLKQLPRALTGAVRQNLGGVKEELERRQRSEAEAVIQPHSVGNNLGWEPVIPVGTCGARWHRMISALHCNASQGTNNLTKPLALLENSRGYVMPHCGHQVMIEYPEESTRITTGFLRQ